MMKAHTLLALALCLTLVAVPTAAPRAALGCPFCAAVQQTFSEEIGLSSLAVVAKLVKSAPPPRIGQTGNLNASAPLDKATFEVVEAIKGQKELGKIKKFDAVYFGEAPVGTLFLVMGLDPPDINWSSPIAINERVRDYLVKALALPKEGPDRLTFFQGYFEDADEMLARDAYDEFAKVPLSGVKDLKGRMQREKLIGWIKDPRVQASRRRLYLTMLGVCGTHDDADMLESMIRSKDDQAKKALDALVAAYLTLKGADGLPLIEKQFLANKDADYNETYATIMAIRVHGQEGTAVPKERLVKSLRLMLERPQLADQVIVDLARWQDWESMPKLMELFKTANDDSIWVRVPVVNYLRACPLPEAKKHLAECEKIDADAVRRASAFFPFGAAGAAKTSPAANNANKPSAGKDAAPAKTDQGKPAETPKAGQTQTVNPQSSSVALAQAEPQAPASGVPLAAAAFGGDRLASAAKVNTAVASSVGVVGAIALAGLGLWVTFSLILREPATAKHFGSEQR